MERQGDLTLRKGDPIANIRMEYLNEDIMAEYFTMLKDVMTKENLLNSLSQICNVGMPLDHHPPKVISRRGQKEGTMQKHLATTQITVIACVSATGHAIPPYVIFDAKGMNYEWMKGEVPGTQYGLSDSGWVDTELFKSGWLDIS